MTKYWIRFEGNDIITVFKNFMLNAFETECEENLLISFENFKVVSFDINDFTCVIEKIIAEDE